MMIRFLPHAKNGLCTRITFTVMPAKAGIQAGRLGAFLKHWIPAFAGMTNLPQSSDTRCSDAFSCKAPRTVKEVLRAWDPRRWGCTL